MLLQKLRIAGKSIYAFALPAGIKELEKLLGSQSDNPQVIIAGITDLVELAKIIQHYKEIIPNYQARFYLVYPKKTVNIGSPIGRDELRQALQLYEFEANKLVSVNENYSCMGVKSATHAVKITRPSQCVADYQDKVAELIEYLQTNLTVTELFLALTPGYQRDWARFIYSAVQEKTRMARQQILVDALIAGYKTHDAYKKAIK